CRAPGLLMGQRQPEAVLGLIQLEGIAPRHGRLEVGQERLRRHVEAARDAPHIASRRHDGGMAAGFLLARQPGRLFTAGPLHVGYFPISASTISSWPHRAVARLPLRCSSTNGWM